MGDLEQLAAVEVTRLEEVCCCVWSGKIELGRNSRLIVPASPRPSRIIAPLDGRMLDDMELGISAPPAWQNGGGVRTSPIGTLSVYW